MVDKLLTNRLISFYSRHLRLFIRFRIIDIMKVLEYRASFTFWVIINILWSLFNILFFGILVGVSGSIGGWNRQEVFLLLGIFTLIDAFTWSIFYANMSEYSADIFDGRLSLLLCRPVNTQFYLMTRKLNPQIVFRLMIGLIIIVASVTQLHMTVTFFSLFLFIVFLGISFLFLYSFWFLLTTCAFFFERLDNLNDIVPAARRIWQVPRTVYFGTIGVILTNLIPFFLITSIPSEILLNRFDPMILVYYFFFTIFLLWLTNRFFHFAVRHFSGMAN